MILRRLADAIREQNWFTVVLEVLIVGVGIFIGLQLDDWNQARAETLNRTPWELSLARTFGGSGLDYGYALQLTEDGGALVAGSTQSKGASEWDVWVLRLDAKGNLLWDRTFGGRGHDVAFDLQLTSDGGALVAGVTESMGLGGFDVWLLRLDAKGNLLWDRTFGGSGNEEAHALQLTADGGAIMVGRAKSKGASEWDVWMLRLDAKGNLLWDRTLGGSGDDAAEALQLTADGGAILAGWTSSNGAGGSDVWVLRLDPPKEP